MNHLGDTNKMVGEDHIRDATKMVSDTPRTDRVLKNCNGWHHVPIELARELERELNAASKQRDDALMMLGMYRMKSDEQRHRIKRLEEALDLVIPNCSWVHHSKKHQHKCGEPCPVVALIEKSKEAKL